MNTVKISKTRTRVIAHRGLSGIECENTNAAFVAAANRSYYGIETDIHVTSDGRFVVLHDSKTTRVSETEVDVDKQTFDEIKDVILRNPRIIEAEQNVTRRDLVIPTLEEYLSICKKYEKVAVIELKGLMYDHLEQLIETVKTYGDLEKTVFISFDWGNVVGIRRLLPEQKVQFLCNKWEDDLIEKLVKNNLDLDISYPALSAEIVQRLHANGIEVNCWTTDTADTAERLMGYGVDYITTNILEQID